MQLAYENHDDDSMTDDVFVRCLSQLAWKSVLFTLNVLEIDIPTRFHSRRCFFVNWEFVLYCIISGSKPQVLARVTVFVSEQNTEKTKNKNLSVNKVAYIAFVNT